MGTRLMTKRDIFIRKDIFMNIVMGIEEWDGTVPLPAVLKPEPLWTGEPWGMLCGVDWICFLLGTCTTCMSYLHGCM